MKIPDSISKEIQAAAEIQQQLFALKEPQNEELSKKIFSIIDEKLLPLSQIVHSFLVASEHRILLTPHLVGFLKSLISIRNEILPEVKIHLLHSFIQPALIHNPHCFFLRQCMDNGILTPEEVVQQIRYFYMMRPSNPERLFTSICWFAPEIESLDKELFDTIMTMMAICAQSGMLHEVFLSFFNIYGPLHSNNWEILKSCLSFGFNPDKYAIIIAHDDVERLKQDKDLDPNFLIPVCIFDCTRMLDAKPPLIHVAAFFGAEKCFDYLISKGSDPKLTTSKWMTLAQYAFAGGNSNIISKVLKMDISFNGIYEICAKFHRNELFDYLVQNHIKCCDINPYQIVFTQCAASNNISLMLKCLEKDININEADHIYY
ncbi:ankyrin repeat protein [Histomonas meleagridis]|uniref:ankyrin repeat protein n=1 Tax=Histomonas meleagridis TaxID=135588 RepID=UPI00355A67EC|nr:ankyrin repeat protein [Histomonas meleagridis]KAH0806416.1 ankyrin repeat protein [Histomonas meleagridis]